MMNIVRNTPFKFNNKAIIEFGIRTIWRILQSLEGVLASVDKTLLLSLIQ